MPNLVNPIAAPGTTLTPGQAPGTTDLLKPLGQDNPLAGQNYFDPSVDKTLIPEQLNTDVKGLLSHGLDVPPIVGAPAPLHSADDPMVKAIQSRYTQKTDNALRSAKQNIDVNAPVEQANQASTVEKELAAEYAVSTQNAEQQYQYQVQRQSLYNQYQSALAQQQQSVFGAIFSGIGTIGGAIIGGAVGGPAGALAGAGIGSKA